MSRSPPPRPTQVARDSPSSTAAIAIGLHQSGRLVEAEQAYRRLIREDRRNAELLHLLGMLCHQLGREDEAIELMRQSVELSPNTPGFQSNLGTALGRLGRHAEAAECFLQAMRLNPDFAPAHGNFGTALELAGDYKGAVAALRKATALAPADVGLKANLSNALRKSGEVEEAVAVARDAVRSAPAHLEARNSLGVGLLEQAKPLEAVAVFQTIIADHPSYAEARFNLGIAQLTLGDFVNGWGGYEWRWRTRGGWSAGAAPPGPRWDGSDPAGKTLLIWTEQGFGDTFQFIRYTSVLRARQARVVVRCQTPLRTLLAGAAVADEIVGMDQDLPPFDAHAPLMSLPHLCGTTLETIPAAVPYLRADSQLAQFWREPLPSEGFKVGIVWHTDPHHSMPRRAAPLTMFDALGRVPGVRLISLQRGEVNQQVRELHGQFEVEVLSLDEISGAFSDTAAVIEHVDLVISVDTSIAHLAAAMGKITWIALPFAPEWRWMLDRSDSPWYPTLRLFRQTRSGDWAGVFDRMARELWRRVKCRDH